MTNLAPDGARLTDSRPSAPQPSSAQLDGGSFRDRQGRVFHHQDKIYRALSADAWAAWRVLAKSGLFTRAVAAGKLVETREAKLDPAVLQTVTPAGIERWTGVLEHAKIPFLSYPYEWCFSMLRDGALLQLELLREALAEDLTLKDASAYNIQFVGRRPTFIDIASFEPWQPGEPWVGYLQFCQLFLFPLLLTAHRDLPFQPWLRGAIDGITPEQANRLFSLRDRLRPGVLADVYLQAKLQAHNAAGDQSVRAELKKTAFKKEVITANVTRLQRLIGKLRWRRGASEWGGYASDNSYDESERRKKADFVERAAAGKRRQLAWDLGANTGDYSRIVARHADYVVALDGDHLAVERMYRALSTDGPDNILPLYCNLADLSPARGWRGRERRALDQRRQPDLVLALALIHHLVISAHLPLGEVLDWLHGLGAELVIEFVAKNDPMVKRLLRNKPDIYRDYELEVFERLLTARWQVLDTLEILGGSRKLYFARPKTAS